MNSLIEYSLNTPINYDNILNSKIINMLKNDNMSGGSQLSSFLKDDTIVKMRELSKQNENTISAYNTLFASLLGDTNG